MNIISIGILGLRLVTGNKKGIAIVTQPLSSIMFEKMKSKDVKTAVLTMTGKLKNEEGQDDADLDALEKDVLDGVYPVVIGKLSKLKSIETWENPPPHIEKVAWTLRLIS